MSADQMKNRMAQLEKDVEGLREVEASLRQEMEDLQKANRKLRAQVHAHNRELEEQLDVCQRFVPQMLIRTHSQGFTVEGGLSQDQRFSVFSCDIRNFTTFSKSMWPCSWQTTGFFFCL